MLGLCRECHKQIPSDRYCNSKYCSETCRNKHTFAKPEIKVNCSGCRKELVISKKRYRQGKNGRFFCSHQCQIKVQFGSDPAIALAWSLGWKGWYGVLKIRAMQKISPELKCSRCGCDLIKLLEVNHINGGGGKERAIRRSTMILKDIVRGVRKTDDLNLLCKVCNILHYVESKGIKGFVVTYKKA